MREACRQARRYGFRAVVAFPQYLPVIVEALEGPTDVVQCTEDPACCERSVFCATRDVWSGVSRAIDNHLSGITLADMAGRQRQMQETRAATYSI